MSSYSRRLRDALAGGSDRQQAALRSLALAALYCILVASPAHATNVTGTVTDAASGGRLASMVVRAYTAAGQDTSATTTDSSGRYTLGLPPGDYRILAYDQSGVYATSFGPGADSFETAPILHLTTADVANYNFALPVGGSMTGNVSAAGGSVSQAVVAVYNLSGTRRGFTAADNSGNYSIVVPPGHYKVVAYDDSKRYAPEFFRFQGSFADANDVQVTQGNTTSPIDFELPLAGHITGFVTDRNTGAAVSGLFISVYDLDSNLIATLLMKTDQFDLPLRAGTYRLVVADLSHQYAPEFYGGANTFANSTPVTVTAGGLQAGVQFRVLPAGHVAGRISTADNGALANITVAAYNADGTQRTTTASDAGGRYQIDLPPGAYKLVAFDNALVYAPKFFAQAIDYLTAQEIDVLGGVTSTADFKLDVGGNFVGTARDAVTGAVVQGARIDAYDSNGQLVTSATTGIDGKYRLVVAAAAYRLVASDDLLRYVTAFIGATAFEPSTEIAVAGGASQIVDFQLNSGILFEGRVTNQAQLPVTGVDVAILDPQGNRVATARSKNGQFQVVLPPGTYKLLAVDPQHRYAVNFYNEARTLASATPITIKKDSPPPVVTFVLFPAPRRRSARS